MDHPTRILIFDNNPAYPHLLDGAYKVSNQVSACSGGPNLPEMTASLMLPCSSLAMRSASSIRSVPKPFGWGASQQRGNVTSRKNKKNFAYLMLELGWVSSMHRHSSAIYMELPHDARPTFRPTFLHKFWAKCPLFGALPQPKQSDEDITLRIFIRNESFPTTVRSIVSP